MSHCDVTCAGMSSVVVRPGPTAMRPLACVGSPPPVARMPSGMTSCTNTIAGSAPLLRAVIRKIRSSSGNTCWSVLADVVSTSVTRITSFFTFTLGGGEQATFSTLVSLITLPTLLLMVLRARAVLVITLFAPTHGFMRTGAMMRNFAPGESSPFHSITPPATVALSGETVPVSATTLSGPTNATPAGRRSLSVVTALAVPPTCTRSIR